MVKADHGSLPLALGDVKILHNLYNMDDISAFSAEVHPELGRHDVVHEPIGVGA